MISLTNTERLPAPPAEAWRLFEQMDEHYSAWLPEHLRWRTLRGKPLCPGTVWFVDEWVGPLRVQSRFFVEHAVPGRYFSFRIGLPAALIGVRGSFAFEPVGGSETEMTQRIELGYRLRLAGPLADLLLRVLLPIREFRRHMVEEGAALAILLSR